MDVFTVMNQRTGTLIIRPCMVCVYISVCDTVLGIGNRT